nr:hypothetical protein CPGR_04920 [Mycolicibacterium malmesburyense]
MRLQVSDVAGPHARAYKCIGDDALLRNAVGHRQPAGCAVLIDCATADHGPDPVAVADRVLEAFDGDDTAALTAHVAVGSRVEGLASAVGGEHPGVGERDHRRGRQQHVHPARQREVAFAQAQRLARLVNGHQRRAARGVDGHGRTLQAQPVADAARRCGVGRPDRHVGLDLGVRQLVGGHAEVVMGRQPHEHAGVGPGQRRRRDTRVLDRAPRRLEQEPVLRVHHPGLARGHPEERRVEARRIVDEARSAGHHLARRPGFGVEEVVGAPAVGRHLGDRVAAIAQQLPELVGVACPRESCRVSDDGEARRGVVIRDQCHAVAPFCIRG